MTYKDFLIEYFEAIEGANSIQSGRILIDKYADFTGAGDENTIEYTLKKNAYSIFDTLPQ